jgi:aspartate--ammonia ligase
MGKSLFIPKVYQSILDIIQTEKAIKQIKDHFETELSDALNLTRISAPLLLRAGQGINDDLNGVERMVSFDASDVSNTPIEIVQSLAKWKRVALSRYGFLEGEGIYTDMNAIRRDEELDNLHSMYVDQWDWEKVINYKQRNIRTLKNEVRKIYGALKSTEKFLYKQYPSLKPILPADIYFITSQELEDKYPDLTPKQREDKITKEFGAVFVMQIGGLLKSGEKHDGRSPDYDDWSLNGDILLWYPILERAVEISSMGIRVDERALLKQLKQAKADHRAGLDFHQSILNRELPYTIGGGIGQSRLCMFFLKKAHIGEVQVSVWNDHIIDECNKGNIPLL